MIILFLNINYIVGYDFVSFQEMVVGLQLRTKNK
jgi:hypothetical protein